MIGWTFCSGIGAPEMSAPHIDWRLASEIEPFPRKVLEQRYGYTLPDDHNQGAPLLWDDMAAVTPDLAKQHGIPLPDIIVAGTPCQAFSIAGLRKGTQDARGNLTLKFVEILHDIVAAKPDGKLDVLWENVPGVLSDKNNAFGCFLAGLVGADDPLHTPDGVSWPGVGMVAGPRARVAWRVLDAQYFGVAQRRRRVFAVISFGDGADPAAVLFERKGVRGHTPPRRDESQEITGTLTARTCQSLGAQDATQGHLISARQWPAEVAPTLNAAFGDKLGLEDQHALNGAGLFVPFTKQAIGECADCDVASTVSARDYKDATDLVAFDLRGRDGGAQVESVWQTANLRAASGGSSRSYVADQKDTKVRRLMPSECARLQGFPDDHCRIEWRGKPASDCPDGPQYKAYGNSMAVPCVGWIIARMTK